MDFDVASGDDAGVTVSKEAPKMTPQNKQLVSLDLTESIARRERSSHSDSQVDFFLTDSPKEGGDAKPKSKVTRQRRTKSLYGACQNFRFGPKASLLQTQDFIETIHDPSKLMLTWNKKPHSVLVIKKILDDKADEAFVELVAWLVEVKKMEVLMEKQVMDDHCSNNQQGFSNICNSLSTFIEGTDDLTGRVDLIICLGGDGTLLYASKLFQASCPPVMAFHLGSLGFLSPFEFADYKEKVTQVLEGPDTFLMLRQRLKCHIFRENCSSDGKFMNSAESKQNILALNEVVVNRGDASNLCQLDLYIEDKQVTVVQGDGLIISTPTGSTAYAVAAGASMVHPNVPAIVIAPICPHSLSFRPIVVPAGVEIKITVSPDARSDARVSFDGRQHQPFLKTDILSISTSKYPLPSICSSDPINDWFEGLAGCLHWNVRKTQAPLRNSSSQDMRNSSESADSDNGR